MNIDYNAVIEILKSFLNNEKVEILGISVGEERQVKDAIKNLLTAYEKEKEKNKELEQENREIRDWKYVIDNPIDLDKLRELDLIKIKGKEYIAKDIYDEIEKDKKAFVNNYSNVLTKFISKDKIKPIQIIDLDGKIHNVYKIEEE